MKVAPPCQLKHEEIERIRQMRERSMLLFITDRCPVGCAHCSVDSRADSPRITDYALFQEIVEWIARRERLEVVGISGGEPFTERLGLSLATERFVQAEKRLVIFTSGVWARAPKVPEWIRTVLSRCSCIYLSTDAFHARTVEDEHFIRAAQTIASAGAWLVVQILESANAVARVEKLLEHAFGPNWAAFAETNQIVPLTNGRGANIFTRDARVPGRDFGPCSLVRSPMVRYDGRILACCNEAVIMGRGPQRLRQSAQSAAELDVAARAFESDPLLRVIGDVGLGLLTDHPRLNDLGSELFATNCDLCWKLMERMPKRGESDGLVSAMSALGARDRGL